MRLGLSSLFLKQRKIINNRKQNKREMFCLFYKYYDSNGIMLNELFAHDLIQSRNFIVLLHLPLLLESRARTVNGASSSTPDHLAARTLEPLCPLTTTVGTTLGVIVDPPYIETPTFLRRIVLQNSIYLFPHLH